MNTLIVYCHPEPESFNAALKNLAKEALEAAGSSVEVSDLYAEGFNPVEAPVHYRCRANDNFFAALAEQRHASRVDTLPEDVKREIDRLQRADLVILQFPIWWHAQPAMLKGWFDRVFVNGGLYTSAKRYDRGHFAGKRVICSITTGAPDSAFGPNGRGGDIELLMWPINFSLHYMGFSVLRPFCAFGVEGHGYSYKDSTAAAQLLEEHKTRWIARLNELGAEESLPFPGWSEWDELGRRRDGCAEATRALRFHTLATQNSNA